MSPYSHQLDARAMTGRTGEAVVASDQWRTQRLGERYINGVVGCQVIPQIPDSGQQKTVRIAGQRQVGEDRQGGAAAFAVDLAADRVTADRVRNLDIDQMRRMQCLPVVKQPGLDRSGIRRAEQHLDHRRGVDNDHSRSRSARMTSAGDGERVTSGRLCKRARSSSSVGRSAICRISPSRYSESDMPASAARDLSWRCKLSGTLRIWIITPMRITLSHVGHMSSPSSRTEDLFIATGD